MLAFFFISALAAIIYFIHRRKNRRFDELFDKLPSSPSLPVLGHTFSLWNLEALFAKELLHNTNKLLVENNGICTIRAPLLKYVLVSDSELTTKLCTSKLVQKSTGMYRIFEDWLGTTVLTAEGALWKKYRSLFTPIFHYENLERYIHSYNYTSRTLIANMKGVVGQPIDVYKYVEVWSIQMILETTLTLSSGYLEYANDIRELTRIMVTRLTNPFKCNDFLFRFTTDYWKQRKAINFMRAKVKSFLKEKVPAMIERVSTMEFTKSRAKSVVEFIDENRGVNLSDEEICNHLKVLVAFQGYDTTASAVSFTLYMLSLHEDVQEKAHSEIRDIFDCEDKTKDCTFEEIQKMSYLEMVIKESLRLYPSAPFIAKYALEDLHFRNHIIPKGADIIICIDALHKNEKYFPNPYVFDPERFVLENHVNTINRFSYLPFSGGSRNCIGQKIAMMAMKTVLAKILRNYKILPVEGFHAKSLPYIIRKPGNDGIQVKLEEREN